MDDDLDNSSPLVKLVEKILDDDHGINQDAYDALSVFLRSYYGTRPLPEKLHKIMNLVTDCDNRVYIPENWEKAD